MMKKDLKTAGSEFNPRKLKFRTNHCTFLSERKKAQLLLNSSSNVFFIPPGLARSMVETQDIIPERYLTKYGTYEYCGMSVDYYPTGFEVQQVDRYFVEYDRAQEKISLLTKKELFALREVVSQYTQPRFKSLGIKIPDPIFLVLKNAHVNEENYIRNKSFIARKKRFYPYRLKLEQKRVEALEILANKTYRVIDI